MVAQHGNARPPEAADGLADVIDLLVPALEAEHRLVIEADGQVFHRFRGHAEGLAALAKARDILVFPVAVGRQVKRKVELYAPDAHLPRVEQRLPVGGAKLPVCQSHHTAHLSSTAGTFC